MFCQLEVLQNCLPQNVRRVLQELPASLDEIYERMLGEILKSNPDQAYRLLQCLTVATRPLGVDELAEILALDFDGGEDGIPELNADWRWGDTQQGVLATCSSLIVVVEGCMDYQSTRVVQFAHFSVKEFLTSDRLADMKTDISRFHIRLEPAHTIIAQSCLAILLQSDHDDGAKTTSPLSTTSSRPTTSPLSKYAARHWVGHARFGNVLSRVEYGIRRLFDPAKPYLTAWLNSYNPDIEWSSFLGDELDMYRRRSESISILLGENNAPLCLYYAAVCGFRDLTRYLIVNNPQQVNATVGKNKSPLAAALYNRHFQVAELLYQHGAVLPTGHKSRTLLHAAFADGMVDVAEWLLNIDADASARVPHNHRTPLHFAAANRHPDIVQISLGHGADVDATAGTDHDAPLHGVSSSGQADIVLIEQEVDVHARDQDQSTPLHLASSRGNAKTVQLLIKHGADVHVRDQSQSTPLHLASFDGKAKIARLLIQHGADVDARDQGQSTPLHLASIMGAAETVQLLIKHGADVHARDKYQSTPLLRSLDMRNFEIAQLLIKHGADVNSRSQSQLTPLHLVSSYENTEMVQLLIKHGADVHARDEYQSTPLHLALSNAETVQLLIKHGADVQARNQSQETPLHLAWSAEAVQLLIEHGADVNARDESQSTPLHLASSKGRVDAVQQLIEQGADVHARDESQSTPLHMASSLSYWRGGQSTVRLLIEHGANVNVHDKNHQTPLHCISSCEKPNAESLLLLLENGADVEVEDDEGFTPYQIALAEEHYKMARLLRDHHARIV